jgi:hypothetical protein
MAENKIDKDISLFLPYELKKQPDFEGIKTWSIKKFKIMKYLGYACFIIAIFQLFIINYASAIMDNISSIITFILFIIMGISVSIQKKKYNLSDKEIEIIVNHYQSKKI